MSRLQILGFIFLLSGCETTDDYGAQRNQTDQVAQSDHQDLSRLIEVTDVATGEKTMRPMSDFFEIVRNVDEPPKILKIGKANLPRGFKGKIQAVVTLVVTEEGEARDIGIVSINSPRYERYVMEIASTTKFKPGKHQGVTVKVRIKLPLEVSV